MQHLKKCSFVFVIMRGEAFVFFDKSKDSNKFEMCRDLHNQTKLFIIRKPESSSSKEI